MSRRAVRGGQQRFACAGSSRAPQTVVAAHDGVDDGARRDVKDVFLLGVAVIHLPACRGNRVCASKPAATGMGRHAAFAPRNLACAHPQAPSTPHLVKGEALGRVAAAGTRVAQLRGSAGRVHGHHTRRTPGGSPRPGDCAKGKAAASSTLQAYRDQAGADVHVDDARAAILLLLGVERPAAHHHLRAGAQEHMSACV